MTVWDELKQRQLDDLRSRAEHGPLADADQEALDRLLAELEHEEWAMLQPGLTHLRQQQSHLLAEIDDLQTQNAILAALADRYADLLSRGKLQLDELMREQAALRAEYERIHQ